eukprot:973591-Prorocentrum_minimum.AAC.1
MDLRTGGWMGAGAGVRSAHERAVPGAAGRRTEVKRRQSRQSRRRLRSVAQENAHQRLAWHESRARHGQEGSLGCGGGANSPSGTGNPPRRGENLPAGEVAGRVQG